MATRQHVLLVPGFFGFANLGDFAYFAHVRDYFATHMRRRGIAGDVRVVQTYPTASLPRRATRVLETMAELSDGSDDVVHVIGHSSGGLDVRLKRLLAQGGKNGPAIQVGKVQVSSA